MQPSMTVMAEMMKRHKGLSPETAGRCPLGTDAIDAALQGGLERGACHEVAPATALHLGAATGFVLGLAKRALKPGQSVVWIQQDMARLEGGAPFASGYDGFGHSLSKLLIVRAHAKREALWAMEESLRCRAAGIVIAEFAADSEIDLTASRRLSLAAQEGGGMGLLLRHRVSAQPSACATRWQVETMGGARDGFGGLGSTAFALTLTKNRRGPTARWNLCWNHHEAQFEQSPNPVSLVAAADDGPHRAGALRRAG